ncbi:MoxR family ATPase [Candidatus Woesearchaeota archaeon]|nr:MAG: MoxR family ATPase [Candidatus Woesearchaeota archaeon]
MRVTEILSVPLKKLDRVLLLGPPGIGKTEIIYQKAVAEAEKEKRVFVDLRKASLEQLEEIYHHPEKYFVYLRLIATHIFPEDVSIPREVNRLAVIFKTPMTIAVLTKPEIKGVLFIDELTNIQRTDQRVLFYSLIQEKEIGWNVKLSDDIVVVAASNPPEWSADASLLANPLINRMTVVNVEQPTIDEWYNYMNRRFEDAWDKRVYAYLKMYPEDFIRRPDDVETLENFPTPRAWTRLATIISGINSFNIVSEYAFGTVGKQAGAKFAAFLKTEIPSVEEFLNKFAEYWEYFGMEQKFLMTYSVAQKAGRMLTNAKLQRFLRYLMDYEREMLMLLILMMPKGHRIKMLNTKGTKEIIIELADKLKNYIV